MLCRLCQDCADFIVEKIITVVFHDHLIVVTVVGRVLLQAG